MTNQFNYQNKNYKTEKIWSVDEIVKLPDGTFLKKYQNDIRKIVFMTHPKIYHQAKEI